MLVDPEHGSIPQVPRLVTTSTSVAMRMCRSFARFRMAHHLFCDSRLV